MPVMTLTLTTPLSTPKGSPLLGNMAEVKRDFLGALTRWHQEHGDLVPFRLGPKRFYLINHPALAEEVLVKQQENFIKSYNPKRPRGLMLVLGNGLVTSKGPLWQKQRRMMQPMFARSQIAAMTPIITRAVDELLDEWRQHDATQPLEITAEMMRLTLEIITRTMFSVSVKEEIPRLAPAFDEGLLFAQRNFFNPLALPLWMPTAGNRRFKRAKALLDGTIRNIIKQRQQSNAHHSDLLALLLNSRDEESGEGMSEAQIIDEVLTIFTAGHETTANALSWSFYLLSQHPHVVTKLHNELTAVLNGRAPTFDDLTSLPYTRAVLEESLRLYPPAVSLLRLTANETTLAGHTIPKGALMLANIRNIHRHPKLWPQPHTFDPERFMPENRENIPRLAFMPFGIGPRVCIGNQLALTEGMLVLARIAQHFELKLLENHPVEEQLNITLRPKHGLMMKVKAR
jgi:cytochrome P450